MKIQTCGGFVAGLGAAVVTAALSGPGDIVFTGFNADGNDDIAIVCLADVGAGGVIEFCDSEWDGSAFGTDEADFRWTAPLGGVMAGTVVTFNNIDSTNPTVNVGTIEGDRMALSASGETIYGYLGTNRNPTAFLAAFSTAVAGYDGTLGTLSNTALTVGLTAILVRENADGARYTGTRGGQANFVAYTALTGDTNNWEIVMSSGTQFLPFDTTAFTLADSIPTNVVWLLDPVTPPVVTTAPSVAIEITMQSLSNGTLAIGYGGSQNPTAWGAWSAATPTNAAAPYIATAEITLPTFGEFYYAARWSDSNFTYYGVNADGQTNATVATAEYMIVVTNPYPTFLVITEVLANSSNDFAAFNGDWFELYNASDTPLILTGMTWDDSHNVPGTARLGDVVLGPRATHIVFGETLGTETNFITMWWGVPTSNTVFSCGGTTGLNIDGDEIHIYNSHSNEIAALAFGTSTKGYSLEWDIFGVLLGVSQPGVNGAYRALSDGDVGPGVDVGSPGIVVPEPALLGAALPMLALLRRRVRIRCQARTRDSAIL
jgi:hypothetical protein